jgi:3-dehydroquinate dehydratase/shikimate dehydrogenase
LSKKTLLAVPLTRSEPALSEQVAAAVRAGAEVIELRVDLIRDHGAVEALLRAPHAVPFVLTVRLADEGGAWEGDEAERIALLERLGRCGPEYIDVELAAWERSADLRRRIAALCGLQSSEARHEGTETRRHEEAGHAKYLNALILSHHDLTGTSLELRGVFDRLEASQAAVLKAVFTARDALDACRVLAELRRVATRRRVIALAMGEAGLPTRVLAKKFGAALTFAAAERGGESAPGQPTIAELRQVYRWDMLGSRTRVLGVVGWPVTHSLSPRLHNAAMAAAGIDGVYLPLPVRPNYDDLAAFLDYVTDNDWLGLDGLSVTIPHKRHVARWLDERGHSVDELARRCGAVNTLARRKGGWRGENTDALGALWALESVPELARGGLSGQQVDVLGAGGAAHAVVAALVDRGSRVTIYNRSEPQARALAQRLRCNWKPWEQRPTGSGAILVNCTSVGMSPDVNASPIPPDRLRSGLVVFDTVYHPAQTRLLRDAEKRGCCTVSGVEMFVGQAAEQFELWHGQSVAPEMLRETLRGIL